MRPPHVVCQLPLVSLCSCQNSQRVSVEGCQRLVGRNVRGRFVAVQPVVARTAFVVLVVVVVAVLVVVATAVVVVVTSLGGLGLPASAVVGKATLARARAMTPSRRAWRGRRGDGARWGVGNILWSIDRLPSRLDRQFGVVRTVRGRSIADRLRAPAVVML